MQRWHLEPTERDIFSKGQKLKMKDEPSTSEELTHEFLLITDDQLRGNDCEAVDELVGDVLNDLAGFIRQCDLLLDGTADDVYDEEQDDPLVDPEQRRRAAALRAALESWQQAWRASDQTMPV